MTSPDRADDLELARLTDDQRASDAAEARRREQSLRHQAAEGGTLTGVLHDLAERGSLVAVATTAGRSLRGTVASVGGDFVGLRALNGGRVLVATAAITSIRPEPTMSSTSGDRAIPRGASLGAVLGTLAASGEHVTVCTADGSATAGRLRSVGTDVITVHGDAGAPVYLSLTRVNDVVLT